MDCKIPIPIPLRSLIAGSMGCEARGVCLARPLRFGINAEVQCKTEPGEDDWDNGYVTVQWDEFYAYRVRLLRGGEVHAPFDDECFIREAD